MAIMDKQELVLMAISPYGKQFVCYCLGCHRHILSRRRYRRHHLVCKTLNRLIQAYNAGIINDKDSIITTMTVYHKCLSCNKRMTSDRARALKFTWIACYKCRIEMKKNNDYKNTRKL